MEYDFGYWSKLKNSEKEKSFKKTIWFFKELPQKGEDHILQ